MQITLENANPESEVIEMIWFNVCTPREAEKRSLGQKGLGVESAWPRFGVDHAKWWKRMGRQHLRQSLIQCPGTNKPDTAWITKCQKELCPRTVYVNEYVRGLPISLFSSGNLQIGWHAIHKLGGGSTAGHARSHAVFFIDKLDILTFKTQGLILWNPGV